MLLTHDVKRCINDSKAKSGQVTIISTSGTTAVCLLENDATLQNEYLKHLCAQFDASSLESPARRSHTGANKFHLMAAAAGINLTLAFDGGKLLSSPFHEVVVLDFEPKSGRREFVISVVGEGGGQSAPSK